MTSYWAARLATIGRVQPLDPLAHQSHVSPAKNIRWANVGDLKIYFKSLDI